MSNIQYRFSRNCLKYLFIIKILDLIGSILFMWKKREVIVSDIKSITIVQLGHIGDFVLLLPTLVNLKKNPRLRITVAVNPVNYEFAQCFDFIDEVLLINHKSFNRSNTTNLYKTVRGFRQIRSDAVFELRGDIRIIPFIFLFSNYKYLIGYNVGGSGFLLDKTLDYPFNDHITKTYNNILEVLEIDHDSSLWEPSYFKYHTKISLPYTRNYICINISAGAQSRSLDHNKFSKIIQLLAEHGYYIVIIGFLNKMEIDLYESDDNKIHNYINKTNLQESIELVRNCSLFIGLESGFTHIATLLGKDVIAIYSDTTDENIWKPIEIYDNQVTLIKKYMPCGKCGKNDCIDNLCMNQINLDYILINTINLMSKHG